MNNDSTITISQNEYEELLEYKKQVMELNVIMTHKGSVYRDYRFLKGLYKYMDEYPICAGIKDEYRSLFRAQNK